MTDIQKLKALAEAATPGRNFDRLPEAGGGLKYECTGDDGSLVLKVDHKNDEWGFVGERGEQDEALFLACTPAAVLELIAEIESLQENANVRAVMSLRADVKDLIAKKNLADQAVIEIAADRDQLKAENERLELENEDTLKKFEEVVEGFTKLSAEVLELRQQLAIPRMCWLTVRR